MDLMYDTDSTKSHAVKTEIDDVQNFLDFVKYFQIKDTEYDIAQNICILNSFFERFRSNNNRLCGNKLFLLRINKTCNKSLA
jgi:hypothetical protein